MSAARLLQYQGWDVIVSDRNSSPILVEQQQELLQEGITVELNHSFTPTDSLELVIVSPGVPWDLPALTEARRLGIETIGEIELAWRALQTCPWVAITGTNGKTTTTALIAAIFQGAGLHAPACGNIGNAACELTLQVVKGELPAPDWVIAEVSSYQIESANSLAPQIGLWTTFTPDHLSRHKTLENYYNIKAKLLNQSDIQIINGDDPHLRHSAPSQWPNAYWTNVQGQGSLPVPPERGVYLEEGWVIANGERVLPVTALKMQGDHNQQNLLMAVAAARLAGIESPAILEAVTHFPGVPHRLEHICTWHDIDFINDSKATNYDAAYVGLKSVPAPVILIAGGEAKAGEDQPWLDLIHTKATKVLLIGEAAPAFAQRLEENRYRSYEIVETMEAAVTRGALLAQERHAKVVLLSPACASFDQYQNFEQRGDHFRHLCLTLLS